MELALDILSWVLIVTGGAFCLLGGLGLMRMPDFFTRLHAASLPDTMGVLGLMGGLILQAINGAHWMSAIKLTLIVVFILFTSPVATHALARAALSREQKPMPVDDLTGKGVIEPPAPGTQEQGR
jgi:multicomponent Na+:H+ antiporter subunit G